MFSTSTLIPTEPGKVITSLLAVITDLLKVITDLLTVTITDSLTVITASEK